jgi:ubiquinone/menaquinone biosynthesis C-methylase UbiE
MSVLQQIRPTPFDSVASQYDEIFTSSTIGKAQRESVWSELARTFHAGDRVLEIGCGTGVDACFLAERSVRVVACDSSQRMIAVATTRVRENGLQRLVQPIVLRAEDIATLPNDGLFDGVFSNFGAINCIADLKLLSRVLCERLKPGAKLLLCGLGPCCAWEIAWYLAHGQPHKAFRRLRSATTARIMNGVPVRVRYPTVRSLKHTFAPDFRLKSVKGVGIFVPPSYLESWAIRFPRLLRLAVKADSRFEGCVGLRELADHILLTFERRAA